MSYTIRDDCNCQPLGVADGFVACLAITHHAGQLEDSGNPASILFTVQFHGPHSHPARSLTASPVHSTGATQDFCDSI